MTTKHDAMKTVRDEVVNLTTSPLYAYRVENNFFPVIGQGSHDAKVMFIGEAPGKNEAKTGVPFCGAAGKILDGLLRGIGVPRESVYITNIVKDRPQNNRDPLPEEIELYGPFLDRQIDIIKPRIIVTLGRYAMGYIMPKFGLEASLGPMTKAHGKPHEAAAGYGAITVIPQYHPAAAIYNRELLPILKRDFEVIKEMLDSTD